MNRIIKSLSAIFALIFIISAFSGCSSKYTEIPPTDDDIRAVANVSGPGSEPTVVYYDELRFIVSEIKRQITEEFGVNWSAPSAEYVSLLETNVKNQIIYDSAISMLFHAAYYDSSTISDEVDVKIRKIIDEYGGKKGYLAYLNENKLTDRYNRLRLELEIYKEELPDFYINSLAQISTDDATINDFEFSENSGLIRTMHVCIDGKTENAAALAAEIRERAAGGEDIFALAKQYGADYPRLGEYGEFIVRGDYSARYEDVAFTLKIGEISDVVEILGDYYIITRLSKEDNKAAGYLMLNFNTFKNKYIEYRVNGFVDEYITNLKLAYTEFGESLDLVSIN